MHPDFEAYVCLAGLIDPVAETARLQKLLQEKQKAIAGIQSKLSNESFVQRAPAEVVQQQKESLDDLANQVKAIQENLLSLKEGS